MNQKAKALFVWAAGAEETAKKIAQAYAKGGVAVELYGMATTEDLIALGNERDMTHVLHFLDSQRLQLLSLADEMGGFTVEIPVSELILPK